MQNPGAHHQTGFTQMEVWLVFNHDWITVRITFGHCQREKHHATFCYSSSHVPPQPVPLHQRPLHPHLLDLRPRRRLWRPLWRAWLLWWVPLTAHPLQLLHIQQVSHPDQWPSIYGSPLSSLPHLLPPDPVHLRQRSLHQRQLALWQRSVKLLTPNSP